MTLLDVANSLWLEAYQSLQTNDKLRLERGIKCLYAGLELVLPISLEIKFRLLLAKILQTYTTDVVEACENIRKSIQLIQARGDCPLQLKLLAISMWLDNSTAASDIALVRHLHDGRKLAIASNELLWWMHFDWLAWRRGHFEVIKDSLMLLKEREASELVIDCQLFLLVLLSYVDPTVITTELDIVVKNADSTNSTICVVATLICLGGRIERGEANEARLLYEKCIGNVERIDGRLPGMLHIDPSIITQCWGRIVSIMSLRAGESPTEVVKNLIPDDFQRFQSLTCMAIDQPKTEYSKALKALTDLLHESVRDPKRVLDECRTIVTNCPQLESYRLIIQAIAAHFGQEPVHHVKSSLLESLKLLNGITHNVFMKVIVLLLVSRLYLETDFEMSIKMSMAAYSFSSTAQWDFLSYLAAYGLSAAHKKLGNTNESNKYSECAQRHRDAAGSIQGLDLLSCK